MAAKKNKTLAPKIIYVPVSDDGINVDIVFDYIFEKVMDRA